MIRPPAKVIPPRILQALLVSCASVIALFLWQGRYGFSLWDEGYLWYGAQRVMVGEVPIRDFMAYDPGRYYWSAALMSLWGSNGIIALRWAVAVFQMLGLFVGLLLVWRNRMRPDIPLLALVIVTLVVWMFPRHKLFDVSLSIMLVGVLTFLVQHPSRQRYFLTGVVVGLAAFFGRNHGIYGVAGSVGVGIFLACRGVRVAGLVAGFAYWVVGIVVGYLPMLMLLVIVPGFAAAFWESIRFLFEIKATNIPLPVPWPWRVPVGDISLEAATRGILVGALFIAIVVFGVAGMSWVVLQGLRRKPVAPELVASAALALPYAHFAFSRADIAHLCQGIFPFLIGTIALLRDRAAGIKWPFMTFLAGISLLVMLPLHPGWMCRVSQPCIDADVAGDVLKVDQRTANNLMLLKTLADRFASDGRSIVVAPFWPGAYAVLRRKSPMWEIYALFPRSDKFQRAEIAQIKAAKPAFVLLLDIALDGRDDLRFQNTHALVYEYIRTHYERMPKYEPGPEFLVFKAK